MADLALRWDVDQGAADLVFEADDLALDGGLETAVLLSLFTDRRAEEGDPLPTGEQDRRGWYGDALPVVDGDRIGSRLWLISREKQTPSVLSRIEAYAREALAWLVEDQVASKVAVKAEFPRAGVWGLTVEIYRPGVADPVRFRFNDTWAQEA